MNKNEIVLMLHVLFGVLCVIASVWVFVDVLNVSPSNVGRIRKLSLAIAIVMWLAYLDAGYWYVVFYHVDKAIILNGPFKAAHNFFMESKEHIVIMLLLLVTYLPIAAANDLVASKGARKLVLWVSGLVAVTALSAEGMGAIIAMGVKVSLLPK